VKSERLKWEAKYRRGEYSHDGPPSTLLRRWLPQLPKGRALDVATGLGRNAIYLAKAGYRVDAVDISPTALEEASRRAKRAKLSIRWIEADLDEFPLPKGRYAIVVNAFFLKRRLLEAMKAAVRPGGVVMIETHLDSPKEDGGPSSRHRLRAGELARGFRDWEILELEEGLFKDGDHEWRLGRLVARRPARRRSKRRVTAKRIPARRTG
jgi:SAM-dependent methyltransferase